MSDFEKKIMEQSLDEKEPVYTDEDLAQKPEESEEEYVDRLSKVPTDQLARFEKQVQEKTELDVPAELNKQEGEDDQSYIDRLSKAPLEQLDKLEAKTKDDEKMREMLQRPDEPDDIYVTRLSSYDPKDLDRFETLVKSSDQRTAEQKDVEWYKEHVGEGLKKQSNLLTRVEALGLSAATWFSLVPITTQLGAAEAAAYSKFKEFWDKVPEDHRKDFWSYYNRNLSALRGLNKAFQEAAPVESIVGSFVGGASVGAKVFNLFSTPAKAAIADTVIGAVMGVSDSDYRLNKGEYVEVLKDARNMGVQGLLFGAILRGGGAVAGIGAKKLSAVSGDYVASKLPKIGHSVVEETEELFSKSVNKENALKKYVLRSSDNYPEFETFAQEVSKEEVEALKQGLSTRQINKFKKMSGKYKVPPAYLDEFIAYSEVERVRNKFIPWHLNKVDNGDFDKLVVDDWKRVADGLDWFRKAEIGGDLVSDVINTHAKKNILLRAATYFADRSYVTAAIDGKWGTEFGAVLGDLSTDYNMYRNKVASIVKDVESFERQFKKLNMDREVVVQDTKSGREYPSNLMFAAQNELKIKYGGQWVLPSHILTEAEQEAVQHGRGIWHIARAMSMEASEKTPMFIKKLPNYAHAMTVSESKIIVKIEGLLDKLGVRNGIADDEAFKKLKVNEDFKELTHLLTRKAGNEFKGKSQFNSYLKKMIEEEDFKDPNKVAKASATFEREGEIPLSIREMDIPKAMIKYANETLKYSHLRDNLLKIRGMAEMIKSKDALAYDYISKLVTDVAGTRQGTFLSWSKNNLIKFDVAMERKIAQTSNPATKAALKTAQALPPVLNGFFHLIYPNYLGWNPRVILQNVFQPLLMTQGELSGLGGRNSSYALRKLAMGYFTISGGRVVGLKDLEGRTINSLVVFKDYMEHMGLKGPEITGELEKAMSSAFHSSAGRAFDFAISKAPMSVFSMTENINRATTFFSGVSVGDDLIGALKAKAVGRNLNFEEKSSLDFLQMVQPGYKVRYRRMFKEWNSARTVEERQLVERNIRETTGRYLSAKTQFNYDRISMSQFGREFGMLFSMFTKWPASISSDVTMKLKQHGIKQGGLKVVTQYLAPLAALAAIDSFVLEKAYEDPHGVGRYWFGAKGLKGIAPINSVMDMSGRGLLNSPALGIVGRAIKGVTGGRMSDIEEAGEQAFRAFAPGAAYVRMITEDFPTLIEKHKPDTLHNLFHNKEEGED
jgi:hypothetical protein